jgi:hypothetical protein
MAQETELHACSLAADASFRHACLPSDVCVDSAEAEQRQLGYDGEKTCASVSNAYV